MPHETPTARHRRSISPLLFMLMVLPVMTVLASCERGSEGGTATGTPTGSESMITAPLQIESVDVLVAESNPPQVFAKVSGIIPDSCTNPREPQIKREGSTFTITILGERPADVACAQIVSQYEKSIPLGTLDPGQYTVVVNGVSKPFTVS
jgi:hypothetical protein